MCTCENKKLTNIHQSNAKLGNNLIKLLKYLASADFIDLYLSNKAKYFINFQNSIALIEQ